MIHRIAPRANLIQAIVLSTVGVAAMGAGTALLLTRLGITLGTTLVLVLGITYGLLALAFVAVYVVEHRRRRAFAAHVQDVIATFSETR